MHQGIFEQVAAAIASLHRAGGPSQWTFESDVVSQTVRLRRGDDRAVSMDCTGVADDERSPRLIAEAAYAELLNLARTP